jgi:membrane-bound ClpP family serine protease
MSLVFIGILILFGIILIVLEILIIPGFIVGIIGGIFILSGLLWTASVLGNQAAIITGIVTLLLLGVCILLAFKTGVWKKFSLQIKLEGRVNEIDTSTIKIGDSGVAVSSLRPMGTIRVNGIKFQASTEGRIVPPNFPVLIVRIEGDRVIVEPVIN